MTTYSFISSDIVRSSTDRPIDFELLIRQQPARARVCSARERERRPVDPPPIIQLCVRSDDDQAQNYLHNPFLFMCADLLEAEQQVGPRDSASECLAGTTVSSLYRLKDIDNTEGGFFVFGDMSVRIEGFFRLRFNLFEMTPAKGSDNRTRSTTASPSVHDSNQEVSFLRSIVSQPFQVFSSKTFPGMAQSTFLSRSFSDQGVRIRIRKEHRIQVKQPVVQHTTPLNLNTHPTSIADPMQLQSQLQNYRQPPPYHSAPGLSRITAFAPADSGSYVARHQKNTSLQFHPYHQQPHVPPPSSSTSQARPHYYERSDNLTSNTLPPAASIPWPSRPLSQSQQVDSTSNAWNLSSRNPATVMMPIEASDKSPSSKLQHLNPSNIGPQIHGHHTTSQDGFNPGHPFLPLPNLVDSRLDSFQGDQDQLIRGPVCLPHIPFLDGLRNDATRPELAPLDGIPRTKDMLQYSISSPRLGVPPVPRLSNSTSTTSTADSMTLSSERPSSQNDPYYRAQLDHGRNGDKFMSKSFNDDESFTETLRLPPIQHDYSVTSSPLRARPKEGVNGDEEGTNKPERNGSFPSRAP